MAYLIGIAGGSASGKTSFINKLHAHFDHSEVAVISQDHYYKPTHQQKTDDNGEINFDLPESMDMVKFQHDIETLASGNELLIEEYIFNNPGKKAGMISIRPAKVIVVEGIFIFENKAIADKLDLKLFIDASEEIKYNRRLARDSTERGLGEKVIQYQWHNHVKPGYEKFLLPHKDSVDMVIVNNFHFKNSLKVIVDHIRTILRR